MLNLIETLGISKESSLIIGILIAIFFAICSVSMGDSKNN